MSLVLFGVGIMLAGALGAVALWRRPRTASTVSVAAVLAGAAAMAWPVITVLAGGSSLSLLGSWPMPNGAFAVELDPLSAFFLVPVLVLGCACAIYGRAYLESDERHPPNALPFFGFNLLIAAMAMVLLARNGVLFLVCWEAMAVAAFFLVSYHHEDPAARRAGWVYLIATHVGAAALFAMFLVLSRSAHGYNFAAFAATPPQGAASVVVVILAIVGFGAKAGFVPLHVWLPEAHAAAPSHVSALMSGVLIKLGLYGVLRIFLVLGGSAPALGPTLAVIGLCGALFAICLALYQRDLKRALAYSSVENVGIITLALGVALWAAQHNVQVASLAMAAALLHTWNHALMKGTLFLAAGSVVHATQERDLEHLGGLAKKMPLTAAAFTVGAVGLSALPPLNGFVSEWLLYRAMVRAGIDAALGGALIMMLCVGVVALVGALSLLCFVRLLGIGLLGQPRSERAAHAHESSRWLTFPALGLAAACVAIGVAPSLFVGATQRTAAQLLGPFVPTLDVGAAALPQVGTLNLLLWGAGGAIAVLFVELANSRPQSDQETWACGYAKPDSRMQYRGRSFAELLSSHLLPQLFRPKVKIAPPRGVFGGPSRLDTDDADPITRGVYEPTFTRWAGRLASFGWLQQGVLQSYLLYIVIAMVLGLLWVTVFASVPS